MPDLSTRPNREAENDSLYRNMIGHHHIVNASTRRGSLRGFLIEPSLPVGLLHNYCMIENVDLH